MVRRERGPGAGKLKTKTETLGAHDTRWHPLICQAPSVYDRSEVRFASGSSRSRCSLSFSSTVRGRGGSSRLISSPAIVDRASRTARHGLVAFCEIGAGFSGRSDILRAGLLENVFGAFHPVGIIAMHRH